MKQNKKHNGDKMENTNKTKKLTYKNDFHKTELSVQARIDEDGQLSLSAGQVNKI